MINITIPTNMNFTHRIPNKFKSFVVSYAFVDLSLMIALIIFLIGILYILSRFRSFNIKYYIRTFVENQTIMLII